jgi:hypothetical protein
MDLFVAFINSDDIIPDAAQFIAAGEIGMTLAIQNSLNTYETQLHETTTQVGLMVPEVAEAMDLANDENLIRRDCQITGVAGLA